MSEMNNNTIQSVDGRKLKASGLGWKAFMASSGCCVGKRKEKTDPKELEEFEHCLIGSGELVNNLGPGNNGQSGPLGRSGCIPRKRPTRN